MATLVIALFGVILLLCLLLNQSILYALIAGYLLFFCYGLSQKHSFKEMILMSLEGIYQIKKILFVFILIGMITAVWRASGTIPLIIYSSSQLITPALFLLITFLLNCTISFLTGTALGTSATMGIICMSIGNIMGVNEVLIGGAVLSGIYFGDRCSPVSTSALLVCELTKTDIYQNIKQMAKTGFVPFIATCIIYFIAGLTISVPQQTLDILQLFPEHFNLHWVVLLPAFLILFLSLFKIKVIWLMSASILASCILCLFVQQIDIRSLINMMTFGYRTDNTQLAGILNGGGITSMIKVSAIVCISSSYSGIFNKTNILKGLKKSIASSSHRLTTFGSTLMTSFFSAMIACNQTLTIMLTYELCKDLTPQKEDFAITLEDTAVVVAPLIPWSIAAAAPLATISAPSVSIAFACYLYLIPLWRLIRIKKYK